MNKLKLDSKKILALFFIIIMLGSTATFAILSVFTPRQQVEDILKQKIVKTKFAPEVHDYLLQSGFTMIEYHYGTGCPECESIKKELEDITTNKAEGQIYLQEIESVKEYESRLEIRNFYTKTQDSLNNPTINDINAEVCKALTTTPFWCISGEI
ncbi:MAG: hypothetical protein J4428_03950 [Candidatus Aenigmarchaeota archaeon]|nr:hypothetical protein [Candidatus Aenigmarchaeota archaeon]